MEPPAGPVHDALERAAERHGRRVGLRFGDEELTFAELEARSNSFAHHLAGHGVGAHDRVAVMLANRPEFVMAVNGVSKLGAAAVLFSPSWKSFEADHAVDLTQPVHAVVDGGGAALLGPLLGDAHVTNLDDESELVRILSGRVERPPAGEILDSDESLLVFSSGTTGLPKAVRHTHRSLAHATVHWCEVLALGPEDRFQVATPLSHILGLLNVLAAAAAGATIRLHRRFDLDELLRFVGEERTTLEMAVAPIAMAMANHPRLEDYDLSSLRYIMWGATPVTEAVARVVTTRTGVRWLPAYGASELPVLACNPAAEPDRWRLDSAGLPPRGVELRVVALDSGVTLPPGEVGEVQAKSASVMSGYLPEDANADAFVDGWYRTGDVGWLEADGWIHLTDRSKEMIKVKGFQVAPAEIEAVLHGHPAVSDCAVFGLADDVGGEVPVAAVQLDPNQPIAVEELQRLVAATLATYKQLHHVVVVEAIPRLPSGKVLRRVLRDEWAPKLRSSPTGQGGAEG